MLPEARRRLLVGNTASLLLMGVVCAIAELMPCTGAEGTLFEEIYLKRDLAWGSLLLWFALVPLGFAHVRHVNMGYRGQSWLRGRDYKYTDLRKTVYACVPLFLLG